MTTLTRTLAAGALALALSACDNFDLPNYQAGNIDDLTRGTPTAAAVLTAAQGLAVGTRGINLASQFGVIGREGYILNPTSGSALAPYYESIDRSLGSGTWSSGYGAIRQANIVLAALANVTGITDAGKEGIRGWAKTLIAYDLLMVINVMDQSGAAIDVDRGVDETLAPIVSKDAVLTRIVQLLDEARVHLQAAGATFAFTVPRGFQSFATPAGFILVNRAIKARVEVYRQQWASALTAISGSFISSTAPLSLGAYNTYGTTSGDVVNGLYDPVPRTQFAHNTTLTDAQRRPDNTPDLRATNKTLATPPRAFAGVTATLKWNIYKAPDDADPLIKNEELFLLRAEARWKSGDQGGALADINFIRTTSGGLAPIAAWPGDAAFETELLYNRRYSLLWEGGHRWIDMRRYGRLLELPRDRTIDKIFPYAPLPDAECIPRDPDPPGCVIPAAL